MKLKMKVLHDFEGAFSAEPRANACRGLSIGIRDSGNYSDLRTSEFQSTALVTRLGKPSRVLVGLGAGSSVAQMKIQGIRPDIMDTYLVGVGARAWPAWNSPDGAYITCAAQAIRAYGAVPMFTLYQMAQNGDGNLGEINDATFMGNYWAQVSQGRYLSRGGTTLK